MSAALASVAHECWLPQALEAHEELRHVQALESRRASEHQEQDHQKVKLELMLHNLSEQLADARRMHAELLTASQ